MCERMEMTNVVSIKKTLIKSQFSDFHTTKFYSPSLKTDEIVVRQTSKQKIYHNFQKKSLISMCMKLISSNIMGITWIFIMCDIVSSAFCQHFHYKKPTCTRSWRRWRFFSIFHHSPHIMKYFASVWMENLLN